MSVNTLSYFLQMIKSNLVLYSIIANGNFSTIDLVGVDHYLWSEKKIELKNFSLGADEQFNSVTVSLTDSVITLEFMTDSDKYFNDTQHYFNDDPLLNKKRPYYINGTEAITRTKELKDVLNFDDSIKLTRVRLNHSTIYGYAVNVVFYNQGSKVQSTHRTLNYYVDKYKSNKNIITFFNPNEIILRTKYSADSNDPDIHILITKRHHPIIKYYKSQGSIFYDGFLYEHNQIPVVSALRIRELIYHKDNFYILNKKIKGSVLEVILDNNKQLTSTSIRYQFENPIPQYYELNGELMTLDQLKSKKIDLNIYIFVKTIFGKDAAAWYGDAKFASGVAIYSKGSD